MPLSVHSLFCVAASDSIACRRSFESIPRSRTIPLTDIIAIGVDGGGTSTRVALCTASGRVLGFGEAGPGNYHNVGVDAVRLNVEQALSAAWRIAALAPRQASAAFLGLASVVSNDDRSTIRRMAEELSLAPVDHVGIDHDLRIALAGGLVGQPGIVLIAGTGTSCYGRSPTGETWRAGGWGAVLDDLGGSGWLGLQAMIAAVKAFDGRGPVTQLLARVLDSLELDDIQTIMHRVDAEGFTRRKLAAMARLVTEAAAAGDSVAQDVIARGSEELAIMIATVERELTLGDALGVVPVAVCGGLTSAGDVFMEPLRAAVERRAPQCRLVAPKLPPVLGAALLAIESLGVPPSTQIIENLAAGQRAIC
jgi:N-acetylglucosamine kinase-like BadF-type ATPase